MLHRTKRLVTLLVCLSFGLLNAGAMNAASAGQVTTKDSLHDDSSTISGKVTDIIEASGYTYIEVDTGKEKAWAAGPVTPVEIGDTIAFSTEMPMKNFHSKSMERDFSVIYFVNSFITNKTSQANQATRNTSPHGQARQQHDVETIKGIDKVEGGNTIAEIHTNKNNFKGKTVRVRGQVTKYNPGIMGRNWVHIRDSSGPDDLTVTTSSSAALDDVVVIEGKLHLDKDFGHGYLYPLIVEDAKITKN